MNRKDVIVVGGGVIGVTSAYEFARRGCRTTLIEARSGVGLETSHANGGLLTPSMADPWNSPGVHRHIISSLVNRHAAIRLRLTALPSLGRWGLRFLRHSSASTHMAATRASFLLARYSLERTRELRERLALDYDASVRGTLKLFRDERSMTDRLAIVEPLVKLGLRFELLDGDGVVAAEPALAQVRAAIAGGMRFPDDESGDAFKFCKALKEQFERAGGEVVAARPALGIVYERNRVTGVRTAEEALRAEVVVVAAGNRTGALVRELRIPVPVRPVKGYTLTFDASALEGRPVIPVVDDALHAAVTPLGAHLRLAGTAELAGNDLKIRGKRIDNLVNFLGELYPQLRARLNPSDGYAWTGLRPVSADGLPLIGPTRIPGLYLNTGHGHLGWTLANGSAHLLADLALAAPAGIDPAPYSATR
jgi:D-amino-acid dehydrogenase